MPNVGDVSVKSVADAPWDDVRTVFGSRGDPARCWCQYFKLPNAEWDAATRVECSEMLEQQVRQDDPVPGVIAYAAGEPVGWCAVEPRPNYGRLRRAKVVTQEAAPKTRTTHPCGRLRVSSCGSGIGGAA